MYVCIVVVVVVVCMYVFFFTGDISTLEGTPLKLVDKFTYLGSSVESTEKDIDTMHGQLSIGYRLYGIQT